MSRPNGYKHSDETKKKISINNTGILSSQWKGDDIKYQAIHSWLKSKYGNADTCNNNTCNGKSKNFDWVLLKGKKYERKRSSFTMRCRSCHKKYDMTQEIKDKISKNSKGRIVSLITREKQSVKKRGKHNPNFGGISDTHKENISKGMKNKK